MTERIPLDEIPESPSLERGVDAVSSSEEELNFHELARTRAELRRALEDLGISSGAVLKSIREGAKVKDAIEIAVADKKGSAKMLAEAYIDELARIDEKAHAYKLETGPVKDKEGATRIVHKIKDAQRGLEQEKKIADDRSWVDEEKIAEEIGPVFGELSDLQTQIDDITDFELRRLRESASDPYARRTHEKLLRTIQTERGELESKEKAESIAHPIESRSLDLVSYVRGLHEAGHIAPTPTVEEYLHEISTRMIGGKPMFLHGPTGTGKTSLARFASRHLTGVEAEMIYCNPQTRETNIHGKERIRPAGKDNASIETFFDWGPLAKAMRDGTPVVFDEFTALPKEQMSMIKGIMSAKVGDTVQITGNGPTVIAPGFQMIFTANLKSEKNPERQDIPPEVANEFDQNNLHVGYTPKEESYDIMLARLMNPDGSIDLSDHDLSVTLPKFCEALYEIQTAYTGEANEETAQLTGTLGTGKKPSLKKLVMNQRTVEAVIDGWKIEKARGADTSFVEFLDGRLSSSLTFKEYPEGDRILAAKILASKGFLRTKTAVDLGLPKNTFDFDAAKKLRGNGEALEGVLSKSKDVKHLSLKEIAILDPFDVRKRAMAEMANQFIGPEDEEAKKAEQETDPESLKEANQSFVKETFGGWYGNATAEELNQMPIVIEPKSQSWDAMKSDTDPKKSGEYTLNPETQGLDFEGAKIFIPDLKKFEGKPLAKVAQHIVSKYGDKYHIPGLEYWKWLIENPDKSPQELKDGNYHFFFGSTLRHRNGGWGVPWFGWSGGEWRRSARWVRFDWGSDCRVVLLEK
jgi:MoxR-like ATPase